MDAWSIYMGGDAQGMTSNRSDEWNRIPSPHYHLYLLPLSLEFGACKASGKKSHRPIILNIFSSL
jgi:hypothetical protein